jgi:hypothetical protein
MDPDLLSSRAIPITYLVSAGLGDKTTGRAALVDVKLGPATPFFRNALPRKTTIHSSCFNALCINTLAAHPYNCN